MNPMLIPFIGKAFDGALDFIRNRNPGPEALAASETALMTARNTIITTVAGYESKIAELQSNVVIAEAKGESWLQRTWRPILMLTFTGLVVARWFGLTVAIPLEVELELWGIIKLGIGGYVGGRSLEKIAKEVAPLLKKGP